MNKLKIQALKLLAVLFIIFFTAAAFAQEPPKREMRANWLTTVWRIDWPSTTVPANGTPEQRLAAINTQKNGLKAIFDKMQRANMNTVFFQVRSMSDAMYKSSYENWSSFISSERGADPGWDPLAFAIEEAHVRGMELHAWINPYRYSSSDATHGNLPTDYVNTHPEWLITYDSYTKILNPGIPEVTQRISDIVAEIVTNYDVDGIVFDDYFYGNGVTTTAHDQIQYNLYNPDGLALADWRRENCNRMIKAVYNRIQQIKPYVTFGVSPAGVAASNSAVAAKYGVPPAPVGSDWQYNGIYSDPLAWLSQGSIDYISPQIYWTTYGSIPYGLLAPWWSMVANKYGKHFYSSHSLSAMTGSDPNAAPASAPASQKVKAAWNPTEEIDLNTLSFIEKTAFLQKQDVQPQTTMQKAPAATNFYFQDIGLQVGFNRSSDLNGAPGSVFFATTKATGTSFIDYLKGNVFTKPALTPAISWKNAPDQQMVTDIGQEGSAIYWTNPNVNVRFAIYAVPNENRNDPGVFSTPNYLLGTSYYNAYVLPAGITTTTHKIAVSVLDRYGNEFAPRVFGEEAVPSVAAQLTYPANGASTIIPTVFKWQPVDGADSYVWEVAYDAQFNDMFCARETTQPEFYSGLEAMMQENTTYYWRVKTRKANMQDGYSEVFSFKGEKFRITSPQDGAVSVAIAPEFTWMNISANANYTLEISSSSLFPSSAIIYSYATNGVSHTLPDGVLISETTYYARVKVSDGSLQATSEIISFKTLELPIPVPVIILPENNASIYGTEVEVKWQEQNSKGFRVELSKDPTFPPRGTTVKRTDAFVYSTIYTGLTEGTYFIQVKALNSTGTTEGSTPVQINMLTTSLANVGKDNFSYTYRDQAGLIHLIIKGYDATHAQVDIYSVSGMLLQSNSHMLLSEKNDIPLDLYTFGKGIYLIKVKAGTKEKTIKVVL